VCFLVFLTFTSWNIPSGEVGIIGQSPHEHIGYHKSLANCLPLVTFIHQFQTIAQNAHL
jgi:hypothetical protein